MQNNFSQQPQTQGKKIRTTATSAVSTPAQQNFASLKHTNHLLTKSQKQNAMFPQQSSLTQKNSVSREPQLVKAAAFPEVDKPLFNQTLGKSSSRVALSNSGKTNHKATSKALQKQRQNNTPLAYNTGPQLVMSTAYQGQHPVMTPNASQSVVEHNSVGKNFKHGSASTSALHLPAKSSVSSGQQGLNPTTLYHDNSQARLVKRIVKKGGLSGKQHLNQAASPTNHRSPLKFSSTQKSPQLQHSSSKNTASTNNLNVRISQILKNSQKSPATSERDVIQFYDHLENLMEAQLGAKQQSDLQHHLQHSQNQGVKLFPNQGTKTVKIGEAVLKAISTSQKSGARMTKSRSSKKSFNNGNQQSQPSMSRSNKSQATKDQLLSSGSQSKHNKSQKPNRKTVKNGDEIVSRNGLEDSGPIDLRIAQKTGSASEVKFTQVQMPRNPVTPDLVMASSEVQNKGHFSDLKRTQQSDIQFIRHNQSRSQCKNIEQMDAKKMSNLKKSFSIALLKASNSHNPGESPAITGYNEYSSISREGQKIPVGINYYSHDSKNEYTRNGGGITKRSDSSGSCSVGDVSVNSMKQQAIKNHSQYGALKHLANNNVKPSLFTRNSSLGQGQSQKKLTSFDENVRVNQIRETGALNQKFDRQRASPEVSNRFGQRKNYGSVCVQQSNQKNKPLFFSVVDHKVTKDKSSHNAVDSRLLSQEDTMRYQSGYHRHAISSASSPKFTPKNSSQLPLKSPFLTKESSRKYISNKNTQGSKSKRKSIQYSHSNLSSDVKQMSQTSIKQTKLQWSEHQPQAQGENTKKIKRSSQLSASGRIPPVSGTSTGRISKQNLIMHRNAPSPTVINNPITSQSSRDGGDKSKRHKFSKSREFYGSGAINQINLNSSITQRGAQLKQDNVLTSKRKSHGYIQTRVINSGAMKRRSSGSNIKVVPHELTPHNQTQPLGAKKLRKIAESISPPKSNREGLEELKNSDGAQEKFVDKIVDLLEKRNLINTSDNQGNPEGNKPTVNKILSSLLAAHLKQVDSTKKKVTTDRQSAQQPEQEVATPSPKVTLAVSNKVERSSCTSTVYLGTAPQSHDASSQPTFSGQPTASQSKRATAAQSSVTSLTSKKPRQPNKCKRTPGFKYPNQALTEKEASSVYSASQETSPAADKGEMTSPDELYYVNTNVNGKNSSQGATLTSQKSSSAKTLPRTTPEQQQADPQVHYNFTKGANSNQAADNYATTKLPETNNLQRKLLNQKQSSSKGGSNSNSRSSLHQNEADFIGKNKQYYARAGNSGGKQTQQSMEDEKRVEGQSAYYTNRNHSDKQAYDQANINKESTRFSSNERTQPIAELAQSETRQQAQSSRGSSQKARNAAQEQYSAESGTRSRQQSRSKSHRRGSSSQGRISPHPQREQSPYAKRITGSPTRKQAAQADQDGSDSDKDNEESLIRSIRKHYMSSKKRNSPFPTSLRCYIIQQIVGKGAFGKVALAIHRLTQKPVAIKIIDKTTLQPGQIEKVRSEVELMSAIRHKHIIRLLEVFESQKHMYMVFEYASGGDLLQLVKKKRCLTERESRQIFKQVVYGVAHCHCRSVLHRDIKLDNILLDDQGNVKVCDFGISRPLDNLAEPILEQCGTPAYIAPEILYEDGYKGFKSDIWGLGVLLYAMVTGTVPFRAQNMRELKYVITSGQFSFPQSNPRDQCKYSDDLKDLIRSMLLVDTKRRISIPEILAHPWLNEFNARQSMQQGLNYQQLLSINALQPFGTNPPAMESHELGTECNKINQIRVENLFVGHGSDSDSADSSINARVDALTLTQTQLNEITIDHATVYINEKAISMLEQYGFPKKLARMQIQNNVLSHATASYNLLVL